MSKISVIIPVYKTEPFLKRCVESIRRQTLRDLEIILVDDGSPDNCPALCDSYASVDSRIRVLHKSNGGLSSARNAGIQIATSMYIGFIDSDDFISCDMYETLYDLAEKYQADIARIDYAEVTDGNELTDRRTSKPQIYRGSVIEEKFHDLRVESACVGIYKKSLIADIRFPEGKTSEDIPFNFHMFCKANTFVYLPTAKYFYYLNPESISNGGVGKHQLVFISCREDILQKYTAKDNVRLYRKARLLCTRAYMSVLLRMALYGTRDEIDEGLLRRSLQKKLRNGLLPFIFSQVVSPSRKAAAVLLSVSYPLTKKIGRRFLND